MSEKETPATTTAPTTPPVSGAAPEAAKASEGGGNGLSELLSKLIMAKMMSDITRGSIPGMGGHDDHEHGHGMLHLHKPLLEDQIKILGKIVKSPKYKVTASDRTKLAGVHGLLKGLLDRGSEPGTNEAGRSRKRKSK